MSRKHADEAAETAASLSLVQRKSGPASGLRVEEAAPVQRRLEDLAERLQKASEGGGSERVERQHALGKLTARERIGRLVDPGSFVELDALRSPAAPSIGKAGDTPGDGVVAGFARLGGTPVAIYAQDFTVQGGSLGATHAAKICKVLDRAIEVGMPVIGMNDSGGARIQEGVQSLAGYGDIFFRNTLASGLVPQVTLVLGPCAGGAVYSPALTDVIVMVDGTSHMFVTGPDVVEAVTGERTSFEDLGGALVHAGRSGVAQLVARDEEHALELTRKLLSYLPRSARHPITRSRGEQTQPYEDAVLDGIVPPEPTQPYDMTEVIRRVTDRGAFLELSSLYAPNMLTGLARIGGYPVGIVANQPAVLAGVLDINASAKAARFIRMCDSFNVPVVTFVDVPGFLPGRDQEHGGIIRHGAKLVYAYCEATVPKLTVITRKAYGGAYIAMASKHLRADVNLAWPTAEVAVMGASGAVRVLYKRRLAEAPDPAEMETELKAEYEERFANPYQAAGLGFIDAVIAPRETRPRLVQALELLADKLEVRPPKKHGNCPL